LFRRAAVWVLPKYYKGQPIDENPAPAWIPRKLRTWLGTRMIKGLVGG